MNESLADIIIGCQQRIGGERWVHRGDDVYRGVRAECAEEHGQFSRVETVDDGFPGRQLHLMTTGGGEMECIPGNRLIAEMLCHPTKAEASED